MINGHYVTAALELGGGFVVRHIGRLVKAGFPTRAQAVAWLHTNVKPPRPAYAE